MYLYYYKIEYYDEYDEKIRITTGIVPAETLIQAIEKICNWYGEENINECKLEYVNVDDTELIEIEELKKFLEMKNEDEEKEK